MTQVQSPSSEEIHQIFEDLAPRYDLFNDLTSLGLARSWRKRVLSRLRPGMRVLDVGCGSGDLTLGAIRRVGPAGEVVGLDFSARMLEVAQRRASQLSANLRNHLRFLNEKAQNLPLSQVGFDAVISGFVLRNLYEDLDKILKGILNSLKPDGAIYFLDMTLPENKIGQFLFNFYMNHIAVIYGWLLLGKKFPKTYIAESAARFFKARKFVERLGAAGFTAVSSENLFLGMVTLYRARTP